MPRKPSAEPQRLLCVKCDETPRHRGRRCRPCINAANRDRYHAHIEVSREQVRKRYWQTRDKSVERKRAKRRTEAGRLESTASVLRSRRKHPERHRARESVRKAVKSGRLKRPDRCEVIRCKRPVNHAHHPDYGRENRLAVAFLCTRHHEHVHHVGPLPLRRGAVFDFARAPSTRWIAVKGHGQGR